MPSHFGDVPPPMAPARRFPPLEPQTASREDFPAGARVQARCIEPPRKSMALFLPAAPPAGCRRWPLLLADMFLDHDDVEWACAGIGWATFFEWVVVFMGFVFQVGDGASAIPGGPERGSKMSSRGQRYASPGIHRTASIAVRNRPTNLLSASTTMHSVNIFLDTPVSGWILDSFDKSSRCARAVKNALSTA
jgi:hypothetical protein